MTQTQSAAMSPATTLSIGLQNPDQTSSIRSLLIRSYSELQLLLTHGGIILSGFNEFHQGSRYNVNQATLLFIRSGCVLHDGDVLSVRTFPLDLPDQTWMCWHCRGQQMFKSGKKSWWIASNACPAQKTLYVYHRKRCRPTDVPP